MARSSGGDGESSKAEATSLFFPSKKTWEEVAEAKRQASKRSSSANGTYSKLLTRLCNDEHMDRSAAGIVLKLFFIEDDSDLHTTVHHVLDGMAKLGILKRAMVSDALELFEENKVGPAVRKAKEAAKNAKDKNGTGGTPTTADTGNVKPFPQPAGVAAE